MIISASRRTDICAFYSDWFYTRFRAGYAQVRSPYNPKQVKTVSLQPQDVDFIVFWTRNPVPMMPRLNILDDRGIKYYFLITITGYGRDLEKMAPDIEFSTAAFRKLSDMIGPSRVIWRYDPVLINNTYTERFHMENFLKLTKMLKGSTNRCIMSFIDMYRKCRSNLKGLDVKEPDEGTMRRLASYMAQTAGESGMHIMACSEKTDLTDEGISKGRCIDGELISAIIGRTLDYPEDKNQRSECGCMASIDIGEYNTCAYGCLYCYANSRPEKAAANKKQHDANSPFLTGQ